MSSQEHDSTQLVSAKLAYCGNLAAGLGGFTFEVGLICIGIIAFAVIPLYNYSYIVGLPYCRDPLEIHSKNHHRGWDWSGGR